MAPKSWWTELIVAMALAAVALVAITTLAAMPTPSGMSATATMDPAIFRRVLPLVY